MRTQQGIETLTDEEAGALIGRDRESHHRDLFQNIENGNFPRWTMFIQVMSESQAARHPHNPFDITKVWPHGDYALIEVGVIELNRNPENVFAEVEQASFSPSSIVPGISFSPDKMLQARLFSYADAARYRLGVNHHQIPVNAAQCPVHSYHRDGSMRVDGNHGATISYAPNSKNEWIEQPNFSEPPLSLEGDATRWDHRVDEDHFEQPGILFRKMHPEQQKMLFGNTARALEGVPRAIQERHVANCNQADPAYGDGVARSLGFGLAAAAKQRPHSSAPPEASP